MSLRRTYLRENGPQTSWHPAPDEVNAPRTNMKSGIAVLASLSALVAVGYFTASKWAIRHETMTFNDPARDNRLVAVDIAVRRDKEMQANAGMITLPVAVLNHGNTVKFTEYSFLANVFAMRGYIAISIQHDLPTDPPMVTKVGELYVGRQPQYLRLVGRISGGAGLGAWKPGLSERTLMRASNASSCGANVAS